MNIQELKTVANYHAAQKINWNPILRERLEDYFSFDFREVKIFIGTTPIMKKIKAFAVGKMVYFHRDYWNPDTLETQQILVHELAHVVQQNQRWWPVGNGCQVHNMPSVSLEEEASRAAARWGIYDRFRVYHAVCDLYPQKFNPHDPHERDWVGNLDDAMTQARHEAQYTSHPGWMMDIGAFCARLRRTLDWYRPNTTKYIYTRIAGLIDLLHFYSSMDLSITRGPVVANFTGIGVEFFQTTIRSNSAWSPEDIPSNWHGSEFGFMLVRTHSVYQLPITTFIRELRTYLVRLQPVPREQIDMNRLVEWYTCPRHRDGSIHLPRPEEILRPLR